MPLHPALIRHRMARPLALAATETALGPRTTSRFAPTAPSGGRAFRNLEGIATALALVAPLLLLAAATLWMRTAAQNFRVADPLGDYVTGLAWGAAGLVALAVGPIPASHRRPLLTLWAIHLGIALGLMLAYESYYGLDAAMYFNTGIAEPAPWGRLAFGQGTQNISALVGILSGLLGQSYSALKVVWAFAGLVAGYIFYLAARLYLGRDDLRVLYILGIFPSIAFWSSILGKDPITLLGLALFSLGAVGILRRAGSRYVVILGAGLLIAASIRIWLGAIFLAPLIATMILSGKGGPLRKMLLLLIAFPAFLFAMQQFGDRFSIESADDLVVRTDTLSQGWARGGSGQTISGGFQSIDGMVAFLPVGIVTALFRPLPGEVMSPFGILAGIENAFVVFLLVRALRRRPLRQLRDPVLMWTALTILAWAAIYGFVSYQNLGTAFRFKLQVMPLLLLLILALRTARVIDDRRTRPAAPNLRQRFRSRMLVADDRARAA